jgi:DNA-binding CsgD family transcriptional regulator
MIRPLPAGLIDDRIEFFTDPINLDASYCLTEGSVVRVRDAPAKIRTMIKRDMEKHPAKVLALYSLGYRSLDQQMEKYVSCCFGAFDGEADAVNGILIHAEFWPCPKRKDCPAAGVLCSNLILSNGMLSPRETDVFARVTKLDKEIAAELNISEETVKIHLRRIRQKSGLDNKKELIKLAYQKNLIS